MVLTKVNQTLGFAEMEEIRRLTGVPLVLTRWYWYPYSDIQKAISLGTSKINVNTENQIAFYKSCS